MLLSEHVYCLAISFKMTEQEEQWICNRFCIKLEHSSPDTIQMIQKASSYGKLVIGSFITTMHLLAHHVSCRVVWWNIKSPRWLSPTTTQILLKTKITFERGEISDHQWDLGKCDRTADGDWENSVRSQSAYFEGDWGIVVICTMFLVSCIFFSKCLYVS